MRMSDDHGVAPVAFDAIDVEIIRLRRAGGSQRAIAAALRIGTGTVSTRIRHINARLPVGEQLNHHATNRRRERTWTDEQLAVAVANGNSVVDCIRALGLSDRSAMNWTIVKAAIEGQNLSTAHWMRNAHAPGARIPLEDILVEGSTYGTHLLRVRLLKEGIKDHRCEGCQRTVWEGQPIPLELEHINGVSDDHRIENLMLLCPNCHALTPTWRGRKNRKHKCEDCETGVSIRAVRCRGCASRHLVDNESLSRIEWPASAEVARMVEQHGWSGTGRLLGVSDNAVRKRLKKWPPVERAAEAV